MTQKCFSLVTGALMAAVLLMAGCSNPLDQQEKNGSVSGRGTVRLSLAGAKGRTLFPDVTGLLYKVEAARIGESLLITNEWNGSGTKTFTLAPGTWTITVTGYATEDDVNVSSGMDDVIIIEDTTAQTLSIPLERLGNPVSGTGNLRYGGLNFSGLELTSGTLTVTRVDGAELETKDLLASGYNPTSAVSRSAGYHILTVELKRTDDKEAVKSELVHIYEGRTTKIIDSQVMVFSLADFALPRLKGPVSITGSIKVGMTLTADISGLNGYGIGAPSYQWKRGDSWDAVNDPIGTGPSYVLTAADLDKLITVTVELAGYFGSATSLPRGPILNQGTSLPIGWTPIDLVSGGLPPNIAIQSVSYGNGKWFIAGYEPPAIGAVQGIIAYSPDDGASWIEINGTLNTFGTAQIWDIAYGNGTWVAVGGGGKMAYSSDEGASWTGIPPGTDNGTSSTFGTADINGIAYGNGTWVAVGGGGKMAYSSDGIHWTGIPPGTDNGTSSTFGTTVINGIAYGNGTWVAVGMEGKIAYSSDGIHWTGVSPSPNPGLTLNGVAYGDGKWIACGTLVSGSNSNKLVSSVDNGISWTANSGANSIFYSGISNGYSILGIAYGGGNWVVVGNGPSSGGKRGFSSDGGASWTEISSPFGTSNIRDVAYGGAAGSEQFFAVGDASKIDFSN